MQSPAVDVEELHNLPRRDSVERVGILEVVVPNLLDSVAKEFGNAPFSRLVAGEIIAARFVDGFYFDADDSRGIVVDACVVKGEPGGAAEAVLATVVGGIPHGIREDCREGTNPPKLIAGNHHEEGEDRLPDGKEIVVRWFPLDGGEGIVRLLEEERNGRRHHVMIVAV